MHLPGLERFSFCQMDSVCVPLVRSGRGERDLMINLVPSTYIRRGTRTNEIVYKVLQNK
jgi:hypothetical protein